MPVEEGKKTKPLTEEPKKAKPAAEETKKAKPAGEETKKAKPAAAEVKKKEKKSTRVSSYYKTADGKLQRKLKYCPRCGPGTFLAQHYDRLSCGKCGYAEFVRKSESSG